MKEPLNIFTPLHKKTSRNYLERMQNNKVQCMKVACRFDYDYWDGDRSFGYGGYHYDGRWEKVATELIKKYDLSEKSRILDIGCGKAYLLYELKKQIPALIIVGTDISSYALTNAKEEIQSCLIRKSACSTLDYAAKYFDLIISLNVLHNLEIFDLKKSLAEIERLGKNTFIVVESYRNEEELFNLQCWALTCKSFYSEAEWQWLFNKFGYNGDYEFIFFEK